MKQAFWTRVYFKDFIRHFRKLSDEQIVEDIRQSMDDVEDLKSDGDSFGAQMVRWSAERLDSPAANASRANGRSGGRPIGNSRAPKSKEEFENFIYEPENNINTSYAWEWYDIHSARNWTFEDGSPIKNWKGALTAYCKSKEGSGNDELQ